MCDLAEAAHLMMSSVDCCGVKDDLWESFGMNLLFISVELCHMCLLCLSDFAGKDFPEDPLDPE